MTKQYKVVIVGAGSTYTPGIIKSLINNYQRLPLKEIALQDIDQDKLEVMGQYMKILVSHFLPEVKVSWSLKREEVFVDADFIFVQIRPGGLEYREMDEKIPLRHGLIGQETCGPGGFAFAMRTIKPMLEIVGDAMNYAPNAWVLNYSNPEALVSEAIMQKYPEAKVLCLCDMPIGEELALADLLEKDIDTLTFDYHGLNHFGWFTHIYDETGVDYVPKIIDDVLSGKMTTFAPHECVGDTYWEDVFNRIVKLIRLYPDAIPLCYLEYYLCPDEMISHMDPNYSRANAIMDGRLIDVYKEAREVIEKGELIDSRLNVGCHGDYVINIATAIAKDLKQIFIANVKNNGAITNFDDDVIVEVPCLIDSRGATPLAVGKISRFHKGLMEAQKAYELLTVEAFFEESYTKALQALSLNKSIPNMNKAKAVLDDLIEFNKDYFPIFK